MNTFYAVLSLGLVVLMGLLVFVYTSNQGEPSRQIESTQIIERDREVLVPQPQSTHTTRIIEKIVPQKTSQPAASSQTAPSRVEEQSSTSEDIGPNSQ